MLFFFFKQKTAYELRISDWSSDVCSSDLREVGGAIGADVLHDHVDLDVGSADRSQDRGSDTGAIRHAGNGELGLVAVERDSGNERIFHHLAVLKRNQGAGAVDERRHHAQRDFVFAREFHETGKTSWRERGWQYV